MKTLRLITVLVAMIVLTGVVSHAQPKRKTAAKPVPRKAPLTSQAIAQSGTFEDGIYKNGLLGFSIAIPDGWELNSEEMNKAGLKAGRDQVAAGRSRQIKTGLVESVARTSVLFQTFVPGGGISSGVETLPGAMTVAAYVAQNKNFALTTHKGATLTRDSYRKVIGGVTFTAFEIDIPRNDQSVKQIYLVTSRRNVMFFLILTYMNDELKQTMIESIDTVEFEK